MYGAILGDIAGSRFEFSRPTGFDHRTVTLFGSGCRYTDDTVLTVATRVAVLTGIPYAKAYGRFGRMYRGVGYGTLFQHWLDNHSEKGYGSYGNGAAMRVSFIADHFETLEKVEEEAKKSAVCTHDHESGWKAAVAVAGTVFLARQGADKKELARYFRRFGYETKKPLWAYRPGAKFDATADGSVPLAFRCFLESTCWETCIRNVFSVKCDTDTVACIAGGIAEAFYGKTVPNEAEILRQYLVQPNALGEFDYYLYQCATGDVPTLP